MPEGLVCVFGKGGNISKEGFVWTALRNTWDTCRNTQMFSFLCLAVNTHSGACGQVLLNVNTGSAPLESRKIILTGSFGQFKTLMWPVKSHTGHYTSVCVLLHCLTSHQSKERWKNKKATVFFYPFKVKSIQHGHDATTGNEQITKLWRYAPLVYSVSAQKEGSLMKIENLHLSGQNKTTL